MYIGVCTAIKVYKGYIPGVIWCFDLIDIDAIMLDLGEIGCDELVSLQAWSYTPYIHHMGNDASDGKRTPLTTDGKRCGRRREARRYNRGKQGWWRCCHRHRLWDCTRSRTRECVNMLFRGVNNVFIGVNRLFRGINRLFICVNRLFTCAVWD